ncbi:MAG: DNA-directed RNA polymerase subunit omega [Actinobacteria bacterium]|nr:DNA-directed RNA polymerase subunit omega [Actinomycetota bacterium]|tara:strand:- start:3394 stop:3717 length:324 start_codon:yes stop_codon:yes gene_type:complete
MITPEIEGLLDRAESKFRLVALSSQRARQINSYFNQLGEGLGASIPPQLPSTARKPLSIAFEEISADKIIPVEVSEPSEEELKLIEAMEESELEEDVESEETSDESA